MIALVQPPAWTLSSCSADAALVVVLDGVQDPGNAGAIVRAAEAFGATGVLFLKGTVSPFNPKTLRASAGSLFRVPFVHGLDAALARAALQQSGVTLYAADAARRRQLAGRRRILTRAVRARSSAAKAHGVSASLRAARDRRVDPDRRASNR